MTLEKIEELKELLNQYEKLLKEKEEIITILEKLSELRKHDDVPTDWETI